MNESVPPSPAGNPPFPQIPDHELIRRVGSGAFGEVWLARNVMGTYRAVKVVYRQTFEHEHSYEREFTGMKKFEPVSRSHDGLIDILQVGRNDLAGYYYCVMELGDDQTWGNQIIPETYDPKTLGKEVAYRGKLPFDECIKLGLSLAAALSHLHENGLIHRDIKPSNIIFVNGIPKIADIGLVADLKTSLPMERTVVGTVGFMPPEGPGTAQGDVYSLGKVLYEMSTGKDRQNWPELPEQQGETSEDRQLLELNEVVLKACEYDVRKRYQSAEEMHADLMLLQVGKSLKRLRVLEQRLVVVTRIGAVAAIVMLLGAGAYYQVYRENQKKAQRLAASYVVSGTRSMDEGDLFGSLPWFADALQLEKRNPVRAELHKVRLAAILRECPRIVQMWFQDGEINDAEFSPDGQRVLTAGVDGVPRLYDVNTGGLTPLPILQSKELSIASFSRDGRFIVTASEDDGNVRVLDANTGKQLWLLPHSNGVNSAKFNPAGNLVVTACSDGIARVWDLSAGKPIVLYTNHTAPVMSASFSPDGRFIVTSSQDRTAHVWLAATGEKTGRQPFKHKSWVYYVSFSPDGRYLVTASFDRTAQIFDTETGLRILLFHPSPVRSAEFSPDGRYIVTACWDSTVRFWNPLTGEPVKSPLKHGGKVMRASFSPEGRRIVTVTTLGVICIWDMAPNNWLPPPISAYLSPDGNRIATISNDCMRVWDGLGSNSVATRFTVSNKVDAIRLSFDGSRLLTLSSETSLSKNEGTTAQLWESSSGKALSRPFSLGARVSTPSVSRDGKRLITIISDRAEVWDTTSGSRLIQLKHEKAVKQASFNPAADRVVTVSETNAYLWDAAAGRMMGILPHATTVVDAEFSPDNRFLVTACSDPSLAEREAQVWDAHTCRKVGSPLKHRDGVRHASFSPDSLRVVTASEDRTAQVWDAVTGKRIGPPLRHKDEVWKAAFGQDGRRIVTVCRDNTARVWDSETGEPLTPPLKAPSAWFERAWQAQFTGNGQSVVATKGGEARIYSLLPDQRKIEDLVLIAELLSAHQNDEISGPLPLTRGAVEAIWKNLSLRGARYLSTSSEENLFWHEREADNSERAEEWFAAKFHINHMIEAKPHDEALQQRAARIQAALTRSQDALLNNIEERSR